MARIYTRSGDDGTTRLIGGKRVPKHTARVDAYGQIDELNAVLGVVRSHELPQRTEMILDRIQDDLFTVGANLALPEGTDPAEWKIPPIDARDIAVLEQEIDECEADLEPLRQFILPGGSAPGALLHLARTIARRAERSCVALSHTESVDSNILRYLNRLSDLCFVLARYVNRHGGCKESHPTFRKQGRT